MFKTLAYTIEVISLLRITISPFLLGFIVGLIFYFSLKNSFGLFLVILFPISGVITGIIWGINVWKKQGTTSFMSGIYASPDLDKLKERFHKGN